MEGGQRQLAEKVAQERDMRAEQEKRNHLLEVELQAVQQELRDAIDKAGRIKHGSEVELDNTRKELAAAQQQLRQMALQASEERLSLQAASDWFASS